MEVTVNVDIEQAIRNAKAGQVKYRSDKAGTIHCPEHSSVSDFTYEIACSPFVMKSLVRLQHKHTPIFPPHAPTVHQPPPPLTHLVSTAHFCELILAIKVQCFGSVVGTPPPVSMAQSETLLCLGQGGGDVNSLFWVDRPMRPLARPISTLRT